LGQSLVKNNRLQSKSDVSITLTQLCDTCISSEELSLNRQSETITNTSQESQLQNDVF